MHVFPLRQSSYGRMPKIRPRNFFVCIQCSAARRCIFDVWESRVMKHGKHTPHEIRRSQRNSPKRCDGFQACQTFQRSYDFQLFSQ